jgi:hypothetical protein
MSAALMVAVLFTLHAAMGHLRPPTPGGVRVPHLAAAALHPTPPG